MGSVVQSKGGTERLFIWGMVLTKAALAPPAIKEPHRFQTMPAPAPETSAPEAATARPGHTCRHPMLQAPALTEPCAEVFRSSQGACPAPHNAQDVVPQTQSPVVLTPSSQFPLFLGQYLRSLRQGRAAAGARRR